MQSFLHNYFPYGGVAAPVDNPPRKSWSTLNAIVAQSQPNPRSPGPFPYDQQRRKLPPSITHVVVNDPPVRLLAAGLVVISAAWATYAKAEPQQRRTFVPQEAVAAVADQPYASEVSLSAILQHWRASNAAPQQARKLPPSLLSVDDPPFGLGEYQWSAAPTWTVQPQRLVAALIPAAAPTDDPPFGRRQQVSQPPAWWPPQSAPRTQPVSVDDPPRESWATLSSIVAQWALRPWPSQATKLAPSIIAVPEDNPPSGVRAVPPAAWYAQASQPVVRLQYVVQEAVAAADFVPFTRAVVWRAAVDWPSQRRQLPASLTAVPEDNPPFSARENDFALRAWFVAPFVPVPSRARYVPDAVVVTFVPFTPSPWWIARTPQWWPAQSAPHAIIPSTDNPPFGARRQRYGDALPQWPAQSRRVVLPASVDDPPIPRLRAFWTVLEAWRPAPPQPPAVGKLNPSALAVAVDDPPFTTRRLKEISAYWVPPPTQWRQVTHAGTLRGTFFVGEPSGAWVAPAGEKWTAQPASRAWVAPQRESAWRAIAGRIWKAFNREGWRK